MICYNSNMNSHEAWKKQQEEIERIRMENPSLLERASPKDSDITLAQVGITGLDADRPRGYLRYLPQDFIVEEIRPDGTLCSIEPTRSVPDDLEDDQRTLYVNLIKTRASTLAAIESVSASLGIPKEKIGYAGIKDGAALTSQRISLRDVLWKDIAGKRIPNVYLEPVAYGNGSVSIGELGGNRFTILVRTDGQEFAQRLKPLLEAYREHGFLNYFGLQRFGLRLEGHRIGCLLARGDTNGAIREFFLHASSDELPLFRNLRERLASVYGDWRRMKEIMTPFPYTFSRELVVVEKLIEDPKKTQNALRSIKDALRLYIRGYTSWVVNRTLSLHARSGAPLPDELVLPFSEGAEGEEPYRGFFQEDGVTDFRSALQPFASFVNFRRATLRTRVVPVVHRVTKVDQGVVFDFSLGKGSYATTFLMYLYRLYEGEPVPGWVRSGEVDGKCIVRSGSFDTVKALLGESLPENRSRIVS